MIDSPAAWLVERLFGTLFAAGVDCIQPQPASPHQHGGQFPLAMHHPTALLLPTLAFNSTGTVITNKDLNMYNYR